MNEDEHKTVTIAVPLYHFLEDQKKVRKMDSISAVISRIISEKRNIEFDFSMLEDEIRELKSELEERMRLGTGRREFKATKEQLIEYEITDIKMDYGEQIAELIEERDEAIKQIRKKERDD